MVRVAAVTTAGSPMRSILGGNEHAAHSAVATIVGISNLAFMAPPGTDVVRGQHADVADHILLECVGHGFVHQCLIQKSPALIPPDL